jgi:hypothetical protein
MTKARYLTEMTTSSDQKTSDSTPITLPGVAAIACVPWKHSRSA